MKYRIILGLVIIGIIGVGLFAAESSLDKAKKNLKNGISTGDIDKIKKAVSIIAQADNEKALKILTKPLQSISLEDYEVYWAVLKGLDSFTDPEALEELTKFILKNKKSTLGRDALFILKSNTSPNLVKLLSEVLEDGSEEMRSLALDHLAEIRHKKSVDALITILKDLTSKKKEYLRKRVIGILSGLTGQKLGDDIEPWTTWWNENKNKPDVIKKKDLSGRNTGTAVDHLGHTRMMKYDKTKMIPKGKIIVVTGECLGCIKHKGLTPEQSRHDFDRIANILKQMDIPHTTVPKYEFDEDTYKLDDKLVIIFNCNMWRKHCVAKGHKSGAKAGLRVNECISPDGSPHIIYSNKLSDPTIKKIEKFVEQGGYVFSEDWELEEVVERAFRGILGHTKYYPNKDFEVKILPAPGATNHPYLKGVFERIITGGDDSSGTTQSMKRKISVGKAYWKIDAESSDIKILKPNEVTVLIVSPDLKTNKTTGAVVVTFAYGKGGKMRLTGSEKTCQPGGRVMDVLSHFGKQSQKEDEFVLQNLLLNFIIEAVDRAPREKKK